MVANLAELEGVRLEEISNDLASLTIDLDELVQAAPLAALLKGLADLYRVGVSTDPPDHDPWISFNVQTVNGRPTGGAFTSSRELHITKLEIGTPNKVTVTGRSAIIRDIYALVVTIGLAKSIFFPTQDPPQPPPSDPPPITMTAGDYLDAVNTNLAMRHTLDEQLRDGTINVSEYMHRRSIVEGALRDIQEGMKVSRTRVPKG